MSSPQYFLGVECGGTQTECAIIDDSGRILGEGFGGHSNPNFAPWDEVFASIETAVTSADEKAQHPRRIVRIGCGSFRFVGENLRVIDSFLQDRFGGETRYFDEGQIALAGIDHFELDGIACIAGTGSSCFSYDGTGFPTVTAPFGFPIGDEGGSIDIAFHGLRAAARAAQGWGRKTSLLELVNEYFGSQDFFLLSRKMVSERSVIAGFASVVGRAAAEGDEVAIKIMLDAAETLSALIIGVSSPRRRSDDSFPIALQGGVFRSDILTERVIQRVGARFPRARVARSTRSPGEAAAILAMKSTL